MYKYLWISFFEDIGLSITENLLTSEPPISLSLFYCKGNYMDSQLWWLWFWHVYHSNWFNDCLWDYPSLLEDQVTGFDLPLGKEIVL